MELEMENVEPMHAAMELFVGALKQNDPEMAISYLLDPEFRQQTTLGECLVESAKHGNFKTLDFILNLHVNVHRSLGHTDKMKRRALHHAAVHGPLESVVRLIRSGSTVNCCDLEGFTPLLCACQGGRTDIVRYLIKEGAHINSSRSYRLGETALHIAAKHGHSEIVEVLLEGRTDINATTRIVNDVGGQTPLHKSTSSGHSVVTHILCERGAAVNVVDSAGRAPLHTAAEKGDLYTVEILLHHNATINIQDKKGKTPLSLAVREGCPEIVQFLIFAGANVHLGDNRSLSPLHSAISVKNYEITDILIKGGADVNSQTNDTMESPLMVALSMGHYDLVQLLLDNQADVNLGDFKLYSPLHRSQTIGHPDDVKKQLTQILLEAGARLNARDHQGHIPLHRSIFTGAIRGRQCTPCIRLLVESGSQLKPESFTLTRNSPLYWLCSMGDLTIARYLVQCGWELRAESWIMLPGKTPEQTHLHRLLQILNRSVHSLKTLCRAVVRETVSQAVDDRSVVPGIQGLPLPKAVKSFLCLHTCEVSDDDVHMMEAH